MSKFSTIKNYSLGYQLDKDKLNELQQLLTEFVKEKDENNQEIFYTAEFYGGNTIRDLTLQELLEVNNPKNFSLKRIFVRSSYSGSNTIKITFWDSESNSIWFEIESDDIKILSYYQERLHSYIKSLQTMYSSFSLTKLWSTYLLIIPIYLIFGSVLIFIVNTLNITLDTVGVLILVAALTFLISFVIFKYKKLIFPINDFKIGDGIERSKRREWIRNSIVLSLLLGFIGSLIMFPFS